MCGRRSPPPLIANDIHYLQMSRALPVTPAPRNCAPAAPVRCATRGVTTQVQNSLSTVRNSASVEDTRLVP